MQRDEEAGPARGTAATRPPRGGSAGRSVAGRGASAGRSAALTAFAVALGAVGLVPLWQTRLPDGRLPVRIVSLPTVAAVVVVLAGLAVAQLLGHSVGPPSRRRRVVTRTRLLLAWYVAVAVLLVGDLPLRLNVVISRGALEEQARAVRSGHPGPVPGRLGGFPIVGVSPDYPVPGAVSFDLPGGSQLVQGRAAEQAPREYLHHLVGTWYWYRWEGA